MLLIICISSNAWAKSPLVNAIENGDYRSFMKLVNNAVIKNGYDGASDCPLITYAAMGKDIRIAKYLLEHGANPNERTNRCVYGGTAISFIWPKSSGGLGIEGIRLYLKHGADPTIVGSAGGSLYGSLTEWSPESEAVEIARLIASKLDQSYRDDFGRNYVEQALFRDKRMLADYMRNRGVHELSTGDYVCTNASKEVGVCGHIVEIGENAASVDISKVFLPSGKIQVNADGLCLKKSIPWNYADSVTKTPIWIKRDCLGLSN